MAWELTKQEEDQLLQNSIERVINTSKRICEGSTYIDAGVNLEDWEELAPVVRKLWDKARNEVFLKRNPPK